MIGRQAAAACWLSVERPGAFAEQHHRESENVVVLAARAGDFLAVFVDDERPALAGDVRTVERDRLFVDRQSKAIDDCPALVAVF